MKRRERSDRSESIHHSAFKLVFSDEKIGKMTEISGGIFIKLCGGMSNFLVHHTVPNGGGSLPLWRVNVVLGRGEV